MSFDIIFWSCSLKLFNNYMAVWQKMASVIIYFEKISISREKCLFAARNFYFPPEISIPALNQIVIEDNSLVVVKEGDAMLALFSVDKKLLYCRLLCPLP